MRRWAEQLAESKYRLVEPVTLVYGTVVDPSNLPPAPDEAALLEELELYPVDADELIPDRRRRARTLGQNTPSRCNATRGRWLRSWLLPSRRIGSWRLLPYEHARWRKTVPA